MPDATARAALVAFANALERTAEGYTEKMLRSRTLKTKHFNRGASVAFGAAASVLAENLIECNLAVRDEGKLTAVGVTE